MVRARVQLVTVCVGVVWTALVVGCQTSRVTSDSSLFPSTSTTQRQGAEAGQQPTSVSAPPAMGPESGNAVSSGPEATNLASEFAPTSVQRATHVAPRQEESPSPLSEEQDQEGARAEPLPVPLEGRETDEAGDSERAEEAPPGRLELDPMAEPEEIRPPPPSGIVRRQDSGVSLEDVVSSVYRTYPLLDAALRGRDIADGEQLAAVGNYDLQFRGAAEHGPTGFYRTYRHRLGFEQPTYWGGQVFAGYRIGRGQFEPWYRERQTNDGGEFRAGVMVPLARNIDIDPLRAALWQANYGRQMAEPQIQRQLIMFVREATYAYWYWVGSGRKLRIQQTVLQLAVDRNEGLRRQVEEQLLDPPELEDNKRLIVSREAIVIDAARHLEQASYGLSLFLRDERGMAITPSVQQLPDFPEVRSLGTDDLELDVRRALQNRPELRELELVRRHLEIDLAQATNELLPAIDGVVAGSQDVGAPTSATRDKSQFELDAGLFVDVPVQRRRARGKQRISEGKIAQVNAQRQLAADQVVMEVQFAHAALNAAYQRIEKARESVTLAEYMAQVERRKFEEGESDLLLVNLREQQAAEAAEIEVNALLEYFGAQADLRAALAIDENP